MKTPTHYAACIWHEQADEYFATGYYESWEKLVDDLPFLMQDKFTFVIVEL